MRVAIRMRNNPDEQATRAAQGDPPECFAEFEVPDDQDMDGADDPDAESDTVQVTVVLRGRRTELENPALALAQLAMRAIETSSGDDPGAGAKGNVIDSVGIAVEPAWAR